MSSMLEALQIERAGYVLHGKKDRVAQVDAQIKLLGGKPESVTMPLAEIRVIEDGPPVVEAAMKPSPRKK